MKKAAYLLFLVGTIIYSQDYNWVEIADYDIKFKIPENHEILDTLEVKAFIFEDESLTIYASISVDGVHVDAELDNPKDLGKYYGGMINGISSQYGSQEISSEDYQIGEVLLKKSTQKLMFDNGSINLFDIHVLFLNDTNYLFYVQYSNEAEESVIAKKDFFFSSFVFEKSYKSENQNSNVPLRKSRAYNQGKIFGKILFYGLIAFTIYFAFIRKRKRR